jgi:hypothetical protein
LQLFRERIQPGGFVLLHAGVRQPVRVDADGDRFVSVPELLKLYPDGA